MKRSSARRKEGEGGEKWRMKIGERQSKGGKEEEREVWTGEKCGVRAVPDSCWRKGRGEKRPSRFQPKPREENRVVHSGGAKGGPQVT